MFSCDVDGHDNFGACCSTMPWQARNTSLEVCGVADLMHLKAELREARTENEPLEESGALIHSRKIRLRVKCRCAHRYSSHGRPELPIHLQRYGPPARPTNSTGLDPMREDHG